MEAVRKDFQLGFHSKQIKEWTLEAYADKDLNHLRKSVILADKKQFMIEPFIKKPAYAGKELYPSNITTAG